MARDGFTLIELVVVLAIVAIIFLVAAPQIGNILPQAEAKSSAREIAAALRESRSRAIMSNSEVVFRLDVGRRQYVISGEKKAHSVPGNDKISLYAAREEQSGETSGGIRFFPDGSSTGGRVMLSNAKIAYKVSVDWLTGRVVVEKTPP